MEKNLRLAADAMSIGNLRAFGAVIVVGESCFGSSARFDPGIDAGFFEHVNHARHNGYAAFPRERLFQDTNSKGQLD